MNKIKVLPYIQYDDQTGSNQNTRIYFSDGGRLSSDGRVLASGRGKGSPEAWQTNPAPVLAVTTAVLKLAVLNEIKVLPYIQGGEKGKCNSF